jgi:hypothetical protein
MRSCARTPTRLCVPDTFDPFKIFSTTGHPDSIFDWCHILRHSHSVSEIQVCLQGLGIKGFLMANFIFYVLLTVHPCIILQKKKTW